MQTNLNDISLEYPFDAELLIRKSKQIKRELLETGENWIEKRIAILGGSTTNIIQDMLEIFLLRQGIKPTFYSSEYNKYYEDAIFSNKELDSFSPDLIYMHTTSRNIKNWPNVSMSETECDALLNDEFNIYQQMWESLERRFSCPIIQNNFERPIYRLLGNSDIINQNGASSFVFKMNEKLYAYVRTHNNVFVNDIDYLSSAFGLNKWHNLQQWYLYKFALDMNAMVELSYSVSNIIKSIYGKNKKVLTLDLDNTLWGGVVAEDGVEHIEIGSETPLAEAYLEFQHYIKKQKDIGVLLTIDSKNDEENALSGINHPSGLLNEDDFVKIMANWNSKDINLQTIAEELKLGIDSFVFVDDNPAEREIVKRQLPMVSVPEINKIENYIEFLDRNEYFEVTNLTKDDIVRGEMYFANAKREQLSKQFKNYDDYLKSLEMIAIVKDFDELSLSRITQLTNKTNQFNLTTKRYSEAEIESIYNNEKYIKIYGKLVDKFGDNGIVSVVLGHKEKKRFHIDLWLMSCRVLKRNFEQVMFDCLAEKCLQNNIDYLVGYYYPTSKNKMVKDLYSEFGFIKTSINDEEGTTWEYDLRKHYKHNTIIDDIREGDQL